MKNYCISPVASLIECMRSMDITGAGIALAVDSEFRLIGTISDGDVRKALVKGCPLDSRKDRPGLLAVRLRHPDGSYREGDLDALLPIPLLQPL
ncbi:MAG: hypothetical protein ACOYOS_24750, partial [Syntrophales bacterium]